MRKNYFVLIKVVLIKRACLYKHTTAARMQGGGRANSCWYVGMYYITYRASVRDIVRTTDLCIIDMLMLSSELGGTFTYLPTFLSEKTE